MWKNENDHDGRRLQRRFTSDDGTYSMNDRNYDPVYAQRNDNQHDDRGNRFQGDGYIGRPGLPGGANNSEGGQGYRAYQGYGNSERSGSIDSHVGKGPKGYKRADEKIHDEVCELLMNHYDIDASQIEVEVKGGVVNLGGAVESRRIKRMAEDVVFDLSGVVDVRNNLRILES